ncbi:MULTISPECIES: hydrogenase expression/formation protein HypE [unclassified Methanoculleus]|uniref:hydrogenase expression/formation protein HypE n=1 Tax=unclassified Methanoculleus TaxID=2619537 RepID=UPI0025DB81BC|nr:MULTISPECIES: hydrogenase expression/formation protein HypE [unclassified Methanoculleus]MCK9318097.1 hydrogenase expression/formation protein HypE [Methanoculleus sp.]MDD2253657.1 hydrogenase expression/formation protein HypE [Methanoculleus sp.]MDD2787910.1 hydrogenase expression/formation protein HypE [Methanoculleus sp.]MDD3216187.1 hydrogenase expression/formation protein HypE [Methanoculleus sp.]MDD4314144.1 hydrogenase expression/formation protein HypE [Methanoculleus sp.]
MKVNLMHGAGGEVMGELLRVITNLEHNNAGGIGLESLDDGAVIPLNGQNIVFTTDNHVVSPIFFPGGDIGRIAVCGTINDLAMMGGRPIALSCGMVIPEGFDVADLERIVASMDAALGECGANLVTGDTKVLERGALDTIIINTAGVGVAERVVRDNGLLAGDAIIVSGTIGDHGIAIMAHREGFDFGGQIHSDVAPLWTLVEQALAAGDIHAMKDPTRGGFANAINEMARKSGVGVVIEEEALPFRTSVRSAAGMLGIDPLEVANEGKVVMGVAPGDAEAVLAALRKHPYGRDAAIVGRVVEGSHVIMRTAIGGERFIEPPIGDPVPRVC